MFKCRHTSVVVYGEEFFFGGAGISSCPPVKLQHTATLLAPSIAQSPVQNIIRLFWYMLTLSMAIHDGL